MRLILIGLFLFSSCTTSSLLTAKQARSLSRQNNLSIVLSLIEQNTVGDFSLRVGSSRCDFDTTKTLLDLGYSVKQENNDCIISWY